MAAPAAATMEMLRLLLDDAGLEALLIREWCKRNAMAKPSGGHDTTGLLEELNAYGSKQMQYAAVRTWYEKCLSNVMIHWPGHLHRSSIRCNGVMALSIFGNVTVR